MIENQKRQFWIILSIVFIGFLGISMPYLIFPALFLNPAYSILPATWSYSSHVIFLGITLAVYPLGQFIGSPILGALSDDYGRRPLLAGSLLVAAVSNLVSGLAIEWHHLGLLILSRFAAGLMEGNVAIARAMAADLKSLSKHATFGKMNASISIAYLIGPLLGGLMTDKSLLESLTTSTPFYAICILFFILAGLTVLMLEKKANATPSKTLTIWQRINFIKRMSHLFTNKKLQLLILISTAFTFAVDIFYEFGPVHLTLKWQLGPSQLIYYNAALCLGLAIGNGVLSTFFSSRVSQSLAIVSSIGAFSLLILAMVLINSTYVMILLFAVTGLVIGTGVTMITVKISDSAADSIQGEVMGVQLSLRVLGDALICLFGGALLLISSKLILIMSVVIAIGLTVYAFLSISD